jgi:hypothetical protein
MHGAAAYPMDVAARFGAFEQPTTFLPMRVGTLIRYIREAFNSDLAEDQHIADVGPIPSEYGLVRLTTRRTTGVARKNRNTRLLSMEPIRSQGASRTFRALQDCALDPTSHNGIPTMGSALRSCKRPNMARPRWGKCLDHPPRWSTLRLRHTEYSVPAWTDAESFFDESHLNGAGATAYTRYLMKQLKP